MDKKVSKENYRYIRNKKDPPLIYIYDGWE
jgi:hypothetical protein